MTRSGVLRTVLVLLLLSTLVVYWQPVALFVADPLSAGGVVSFIYMALSITACAGLVKGRRWGFYSFYAAVVFGTIMFSVKFIPIPLGFLTAGEGWIGMTVTNIIVLGAGALAHHWWRLDHPTSSGGELSKAR